MCGFLFVCFWNFVIHFSRSSPSFQCFFILWLRFYFIHPFSRSSRSCVSPSSGCSVSSSIHPLAPPFLNFSTLWFVCCFIHPPTPLSLHPSSRSLSFFFLLSLARSCRSSVLRRACSEELRLLLVFGSVECLASEL